LRALIGEAVASPLPSHYLLVEPHSLRFIDNPAPLQYNGGRAFEICCLVRDGTMPKAARKVVKVLLVQDVYKLGRAGDVKEVARGYARNFLIPQGLAVVATPENLRMAEKIRARAEKERAEATARWQSVADKMQELTLYFPVRASETGKLYGSVSPRMIAQALTEELGVEITHHQVDTDLAEAAEASEAASAPDGEGAAATVEVEETA